MCALCRRRPPAPPSPAVPFTPAAEFPISLALPIDSAAGGCCSPPITVQYGTIRGGVGGKAAPLCDVSGCNARAKMKAPAVDYVRPHSLAEAVNLLTHASLEARVIAGGQSLLALMNLRVASPGLLIDIARLPELLSVADHADAVILGACVTHAAIEDGRVPDPSQGLMPRVASALAYRAIRTRGTIGGSLALSDPAAEWPSVLAALDAE